MNFSALALVIIGVYLLIADGKGHGQEIIDALSKETDFVKWLLALVILLWIRQSAPAEMQDTLGLIITMAIIAMMLILAERGSLNTLTDQLSKIWR
jgi:hypothetical protein